jgi:hypothetical protein
VFIVTGVPFIRGYFVPFYFRNARIVSEASAGERYLYGSRGSRVEHGVTLLQGLHSHSLWQGHQGVCACLVNSMEFSGQRRPPSGYQRSLWREDVGCIENRRATDVVPKVTARWNRTGYAVCTDLPVWNKGRRMLCLPKEWVPKECGSPQLFSAVLDDLKTSTSCLL